MALRLLFAVVVVVERHFAARVARVARRLSAEAVAVLSLLARAVVGSRQAGDALDLVEQRADVDLGRLLDEDDAVFGRLLDLILLMTLRW